MSKETSMDIKINLSVEPEGEGGRFKATVNLSATDAGQPFCESINVWHDMSQDNVDYLVSLFTETYGGDNNVELIGTSYKKLIEIEKNGIALLKHLNEIGEQSDGKSREEKAQASKALLEERRGKAKGHNK